MIKYLFFESGLITTQDLKARDNYAIKQVCQNGHLDILRYLVSQAGLTVKDLGAENNYALINAYKSGQMEVVSYLISAGLLVDSLQINQDIGFVYKEYPINFLKQEIIDNINSFN